MIKVSYSGFGLMNTTEALFKEGLRYACIQGPAYHNYSGILYLAPSHLKVKDARRVFHRLITTSKTGTQDNRRHPAMSDCYIPPEMSTIEQLAKKVYSARGQNRMLPAPLVPVILSGLTGSGIGISSITAGLIYEIKTQHPSLGPDGLKSMFINLMNELNIPESLSRVILNVLSILEQYDSLLRSHNLADTADVLNAFPEYLASTGHHILIVDNFIDMNASERNILKALLRNAEHAVISVPYKESLDALNGGLYSFLQESSIRPQVSSLNEEDNIQPSVVRHEQAEDIKQRPLSYTPYPDPEHEVEGIARKIKALFVSGKFRALEKISVVFPDPALYAPMVQRIFKRYGIPCNITSANPLGTKRPFLDLLSLLSSVADNYPRLKFTQFLSSPYFIKVPQSLKTYMPSLSLKSGIVSDKDAWLRFAEEGSEKVDIRGRDLEKDLRRLFSLLKPLEDMNSGAGFEACAAVLKGVLDELGFLEHTYKAQEPAEVLLPNDGKKALEEILNHISFLSGVFTQDITLRGFTEVLAHILNSTFPDEETDGVQVTGIYEAAGLMPEYLFIGGMTDTAMPGTDSPDYLLPDSLKRRMGFMHLDKYIELRRFIFNYITAFSKNVHISYPLTDGEDRFLPSSFLYPGQEVHEMTPGIYSPEEYLVMKGYEPLSHHLEEIRDRSFGISKSEEIWVTDIDAYRFCPRRFFIERKLKLEPPEIKRYEIEAATMGSIIHKIMERVIKEPMESFELLRESTVSIIDGIMESVKLDDYWKGLVKDTFLEILPEIYESELEIRTEDYISSELEENIAGEPLKGIRLKGKIDRFDRYRGSGNPVNIIDYKTGAAGLNCRQALEGNENLQLFLYAAMLKSRGYGIRKVGIYSLRDINIKWCPPKARGRRTDGSINPIDEYIAASLRFLEDAVSRMRDGDFTARPLNDFICRTCHEYPLCPHIQQ